MGLPTKVIITLAIILGIAGGTGLFVAGLLIAAGVAQKEAVFAIAIGSALLVGSFSSLVAHLAGGFRDIDDRGP